MHLEKILPLLLQKIMWLIKTTVFILTIVILFPILAIGLYLELEDRVNEIHY